MPSPEARSTSTKPNVDWPDPSRRHMGDVPRPTPDGATPARLRADGRDRPGRHDPGPGRAHRRRRSGVSRLTVVLAGLTLVAGCGWFGGDGSAPAEPGVGVVSRIVDGDTIVVRIGGADERVRLIGIDTPETVDPRSPVECFGAEASARITELIPPGTEVRLVRDVEARDRFDRLLAYVYRASDDLHVNLAMVEDGFAAAYTFPPNVAHTADFVAAAARAREAGLGLWGACGGPDVPLDEIEGRRAGG